MARFKAEVQINDNSDADVVLALSPEQTAILLSRFVAGQTAHVNLVTPTANGHRVENPAAYAE